eukprot:363841-Chlamydomonas_euryale.AAC.1
MEEDLMKSSWKEMSGVEVEASEEARLLFKPDGVSGIEQGSELPYLGSFRVGFLGACLVKATPPRGVPSTCVDGCPCIRVSGFGDGRMSMHMHACPAPPRAGLH